MVQAAGCNATHYRDTSTLDLIFIDMVENMVEYTTRFQRS